MKAGEHGPDELYDKFKVYRAKTGKELTGRGEFIFVLRPETNDDAAVAALHEYARVCKDTYPSLSTAIERRLADIEQSVEWMMGDAGVDRDTAFRLLAEERDADS